MRDCVVMGQNILVKTEMIYMNLVLKHIYSLRVTQFEKKSFNTPAESFHSDQPAQTAQGDLGCNFMTFGNFFLYVRGPFFRKNLLLV